MKRIDAFDAIETVAIAMACSMHFPLFGAGSLTAQIWMLVCSCAVPAFFLVNGTLLFMRPFSWKKHLARLRKIITCLLFWRLVYLVLFSGLGWFDASGLTIEGYLLYFLGVDYPGLPTAHMWFMYALVAMYLLFPLFKKLYECDARSIALYGCCVMFVFGVVVTDLDLLFLAISHVVPSFELDLSASVSALYNPFGAWTMGFYFFLGPFLYEQVERCKLRFSMNRLRIGCGGLFVAGFLFNYVAQYVYTGSMRWEGITLESQYLHFGTLAMGAAFFAFFCFLPWGNEKINRVIEFFSVNTITIYYAHMIFMYVTTFFVFNPLGLAEAGVWLVVLRAVVSVVLGSLLGWIMGKIPLLKKVV